MSNRGKRNSSSSSSSSSSSKKEKQGNGAGSCIPKEFMKVVKSMKEIVTNSSEEEIYAVLIECNMDPDEAVQRLLSQDHFHEVKSRREKKKEIKEVSESHSQGLSSGSTPNFVRGGSTGMCTASHSKHTHKDESRSNPMSSSVDSVSRIEETSHLPQSLSSTVAQRQRTATADATKSSQPSAGSQSARLAVSCPLSMADIVKMGTVHDNVSGVPVVSTEISYSSQDVQASDASQQSVEHPPSCTSLPEDLTDNVLSWEDAVFQDLEKIQESGISRSQHVHYGEWPLVEQSPSASCPSGLGLSTTSEVYANPSQKSALHAQIANLHLGSHSDEVQVAGDATIDRLRADRVRSDSQTSGQMHISNHSYNIMSPYQHDGHVLNHQKGSREDSHLSGPTYSSAKGVGSLVSSTATNLQQLSLQDGMQVLPAGCAVNISTQLQPPATELPRVSFGTYGSGISATFSRSFPPKAKSDFEEASVSKGASSAGQFDTRNAEYYGHDHLQSTFDRSSVPMQSTFDRSSILRQSTFDRSSVPRTTSSESFEDGLSIYSQLDAAHRHRHAIHASSPRDGYAFEGVTQLNTQQANSQQAYANSLLSNLLSSTSQSLRDSEYSSVNMVPTRDRIPRNAIPSINSPAISMQERVHPGVFAQSELNPQPNLSSGKLAEMVDNPFSPQRNSYMSSAFQKRSMGNSHTYQSPTVAHDTGIEHLLSQLRNSGSTSSLPYSPGTGLGGGGFGSSADVPGSFRQYLPSSPASSTIDHYDLISQYRDNNNFVSPSQNEQSARWAGGPGSRTMPSLSPGQYYNFQGQNSQFGWDVQQGRKYSQAYGARGYPSPHHSQMGASREHLEQILRDRTLGNVLDYQDLRHSQTGAVRGYQEQILRDRTVGNSEVPRYSQSHQLWDSDMSSPRNS